MLFTREQIGSLSEDELRRRVLIPLFRAMGFQGVVLYHGGSLERGKDIVMWNHDELGVRRNWAVVAKATDISGHTSGKSTAGEVRFQVEQCFGQPYRDPVDSVERNVDRCIVVTSKRITKEAREALSAVLGNTRAERVTSVIDGETLWGLLEQHLPSAGVWQKLSEVQEILEDASPHHRLVARTSGKGVELSLEAKTPDADRVHPVTFTGRFAFPKTRSGEEMRARVEAFIKTGTPVSIPAEFVESLELPEFLRSFLDPSGECQIGVRFGPQRLLKPVVVRLEVEAQGHRYSIPYIHLDGFAGTDEVTLSNDEQPIPWRFEFRINRATGQSLFNFSKKSPTRSVVQELEGARLWGLLSKGGVLRVVHLDTGLELFRAALPSMPEGRPPSGWVEFMEALVAIQMRSGVIITVPQRDISGEEVEEVFKIAGRIETGYARLSVSSVHFNVGPETARNILAQCKPEVRMPITHVQEETAQVVGISIPMGEARYTFNSAYLTKAEYNRIKSQLEEAAVDTDISLKFDIDQGATTTVTYPQWMP